MVTKELYKIEKGKITKDGHTMFEEDIVKELNGWRNSCRDFRNKNALLLKEIGNLKYGDKKALLNAGEEVYKSQVKETLMEEHLIGEGKDFISKEDWIEQKIEEWSGETNQKGVELK